MIVKAEDKGRYLRLFFYTGEPVKFSPKMHDGRLDITFNEDFNTDLNNLDGKVSNYISSFDKKPDNKTLSFNLYDNKYAYRKFISEKFVGIDLIKNKEKRKKPVIKKAEKKTKEPYKKVLETTELNLLKQFDEAGLGRQLFKSIEVAQNNIAPESPENPDNSNDIQDNSNEESAQSTAPPEIEIPEIEDYSEDFEKKEGSLANLFFKWDEAVGASVFQRGAYLWVVFDKYVETDTNTIIARNPEIFEEAEQLPNKYFTILRFKITDQYFALPYKDENNWIVSISKQKVLPGSEPEIFLKDSELHGSRIIVSTWGQEIKPVRLIDPTIGDEMIIIPFKEIDAGYKTLRKYPDFSFIPTYQGVSISLTSDFINFTVLNNNIEISGPTNKLAGGAQLALRELQEQERLAKERAEKLKGKGQDITLIKFNTWKVGDDKSYNRDLKDLLWQITEVDWKDKNEKRLNLAKFYFAHSLYAEAISVINTIKKFDKAYSETNDVKIVEAVTLYKNGKYNDAVGAFNHININELDERGLAEIKFWTAAANIQLGNQIKIDKFISDNPVYEQKKEKNKDDIDAGDDASNTRLIYETSSRLLRIIRKIDPEFVNSDEIQKLESTARFVTDHYQEAIKRFEESDLYKSSDVFQAEENRLWWSASEKRRQEDLSMEFTKNIDIFIKFYPDKIFNDFALIALEDRLKRNDIVVAEEILNSLKEEKREITVDSIKFLQGLFYAKDDEDEKAIEIWRELSGEILDRYNRTRAELALTIFELRKKDITVKDAIDRLNGLRMSWRGGVLEFNILKMLGELYMEEKEYMKGFTVWRSSIVAFPGSDESLLIAKKMSDKFVQIFSQGEVDSMPKLDALTLYYEFRALTPIGKLGDEMISRLADRLIEVDLLERAAALLTHQIRFRLVGEERDITAIKLINVHLKNREAEKAYDVLNATENDNISDEIRIQRKYLKAQTLIELGKNNKTLALLKGDENQVASFLRADVYWRNKVWKKVVDELETPFREIRRDGRNVTQDEMSQLIKLAVSYALIGRKRKLQVLFEDFEPLIDESDSKKVFTFVATDRGPVDFRNLDHTVEFMDMQKFLENFLKSDSSNITNNENGA